MKEQLRQVTEEQYNRVREKELVPEKRFEFTNQMQCNLNGPGGSRIPYEKASMCFDTIRKVDREQQTWALAIYALQLLYKQDEEKMQEAHGVQ